MFSEAERKIFRATVNGQERAFDPLVLRRRLAEAQRSEGLDLSGLLESHRTIHAASQEGPLPPSLVDEQFSVIERVARLGCLMFNIPALQDDGSGWTQEEAASALSDYLNWESTIAGEPGASPSSSTSTAGLPVDSATAGQEPSITGPSAA